MSVKYLIFIFQLILTQTHGAELMDPEHKEIVAWKAPLALKKLYPYFLAGFDYDGTPVNAMEFGRWDIRATMEKGAESQEVKDFSMYTLQMYVNYYESPVLFNSNRKDYSILVDLEGYDNRQFTHPPSVGKMLEFARQFVQANKGRGDRIKKIYLVNGNYLFSSVYSLMKPILGNLANRIEVFGTNKDKWLPLIKKEIPLEILPEFLGGTDKNWKPLKVWG